MVKEVPAGDETNEHKCGLGHQFPAFIGTRIQSNDEPNLILCCNWKDTDKVIDEGEKMDWKRFKDRHKEWDFNFENAADLPVLISKFVHVWGKIGKDICNTYGM
jgi:hypothetical protein